MWLNLCFIGLIMMGAIFFILTPRKEVPVILIIQALLQYVWTLGSWSLKLDTGMTWLLWSWMLSGTLLLLWARNLAYSKELFSIRLFFSVSQWAIILIIGLLIATRSPYEWIGPVGAGITEGVSLHPAIKLSGNLLIFTTFFQLVLHWGQMWSLRKSVVDLGPIFIYFGTLLLLRFLQFQSSSGVLALVLG